MSTTFEVYPTGIEVPTVVALLKLANEKLKHFLQPLELQEVPLICVRLGEKIITPGDTSNETMNWDVEYACFFVEPSEGGGTDAYYHKVDEDTADIWDEYSETGDTYLEVKSSLSVGYFWSFRRSAGQPAIINLAYGFIASALAELTEGFIFSDDGAWYGKPIRSHLFDTEYFDPSKAKSVDDALWYERCLNSIASKYNGKSIEPHHQLFEEHDLSWEQRLVYYPSGRLFKEGPATEDRFFVMLSHFNNLPYWFIDHTMLSATEELLSRQMKLIDIKGGFKLLNHPIAQVMGEYQKLQFALNSLETTFWANPLCIEEGDAIRKQIT
ncbi:hypothetical protein [Paenibacillus herberti]|uniref:Uncharacterized protein n=1 Tax=Paenibacillus herberti TaxID=1619309 RepID=A0A229NYC6_9BACL|nr:hypothetical protein [Paenibacillus herberti]OXM14639.1 hypothetical protein CGZ75_17135 [Paenibacillus herberti]